MTDDDLFRRIFPELIAVRRIKSTLPEQMDSFDFRLPSPRGDWRFRTQISKEILDRMKEDPAGDITKSFSQALREDSEVAFKILCSKS